MLTSFVLDMLTKFIVALTLFSAGCAQAVPLRYARPGGDAIHILPYPYLPKSDVSVVAKREPGEVHILPYPNPNGKVHIQPYPYSPGVGGGPSLTTKREPDHPANGEMGISPHPHSDEEMGIQPYPYSQRGGVSIAAKREPSGEEVHILPYPYVPGNYVSVTTKRDPRDYYIPSSKRSLERMPMIQYFNPGTPLRPL